MQSSGYVRDTAYFSAFVPAQAPSRLFVAALLAGAPAPDPRRPFRYLDLCCGDGITLATLAACYPHGQFVGVDISEAAIERARRLSLACGLPNIEWIVADVGSLSLAPDAFEFISMVGAFSWLDDERRDRALRLVQRHLSPDGVLLLHYACKPGAVQTDTLHQALRLLSPRDGSGSDRLVSALARLQGGDLEPFLRTHPLAQAHLKDMTAGSSAGFAQESLSPDARAFWQPEIEVRLDRAGLTPLVEADTLDRILRSGENSEARKIRQVRRDFQLNRLSRLDVCGRSREPRTGPARTLLQSVEWYTPEASRSSVVPPRFGGMSMDDTTDWSTEGARVTQLILRSQTHPLVKRGAAGVDQAGLSPFNRHALEQGLIRPSSLPLASPTLGTQVVLPLKDRLQLYAVCGGDAAGLLRSLPTAARDRLGPCLTPEALAGFTARSVGALVELGVLDGGGPP